MKKLTFLCVAVMITAALIFNAENLFSQVYQLENPGFEEWDTNGEPTGWNSFPSANCTLSSALCGTAAQTRHERSNDVRNGSTGSSCKIFSTSVNLVFTSITANGALTSGQMQLASSSASNVNNCNQTKTSSEEFNHRLNAKPDSIVFWAKVVNASNNSKACCHLYIHDNYDLKDPLAANPSGYQSHIVGGVPSYDFANNGSTWQRHSAPIIYEGYSCNDPQFVLITFSTNKDAGGGSGGDALYIDDIEFIYNPIHHEFSETACDSFDWDGTTYTTSGDYTKTYTVGPRDSIVTLHLTINEAPTREETRIACSNFTWYGQNYTQSGNYTHNVEMNEGCDSVVTLHLTINQPVAWEFAQTACESYTWNGQEYTTSGDHTQTFTAANGCDSVVTLHLTINQPLAELVEAEACGSYTWNNETYNASGNYQQTFTAANGCDSVVTLQLTINQPVANEFSATACGIYTWGEESYTTSGDYNQTFTAANGCDSVVTLHLTITEAPTREESATACGSYTWYGEEYTQSGDKTHIVPSTNPEVCDSVITLHLTINQPTAYEFSETACSSYTWNGQEYTTSGDHTQTFTAANGCDSVVTLHLTINQPLAEHVEAVACGSYTWNEQTYTVSDDYTQTFTAANGCDSVVTLHLTINQPVAHEFSATACGIYTWGEESYTTSGDHIQTFTATNGCDSVVTLHLTITEAPSREENITACDSYTWYGQEYTESNDYYHTIPATDTEECDSLITLHLTINNSVTNEITEETEDSFTWNGTEYTISGDYTQTFETVNGCDSVVTLHLTITTVGINENEMSEINVYPNPAKDRISIEGAEIQSVSIYDITGREIVEYKNNGENTMNISVEMLETGNYMLVIKENDGNTTTQRIVIMK